MARVLRKHWRWFLIALVPAALAARVAWIASHTETGWETIAGDWREATIGQFVGHRLPVAQRDFPAQTEFWLAEIDRVLAREPHTPELLLGAARILGAYSGDYHLPLSADLVQVPDLDIYRGPGGRGSPDRRESERRAKQLQLAAQATTEFPGSFSAWQTRAEKCSQLFGPLEDPQNAAGWRNSVEECQKHDAENSIYRFLIANHLFSDANNIARGDEATTANGNPPTTAALDEHIRQEIELENAGVAEVKHGLELPKFEWPNASAATREFISKTSLPLVEKAHLVAWSDHDSFFLIGIADELVEVASRVESRTPGASTKELRQFAIDLCELNSRQPWSDSLFRIRGPSMGADQWKQWAVYLSRNLDAPVSKEAAEAREKAIDLQISARQWNRAIMNWSATHSLPRFTNTWIGYIAWKAAALAVQLILIVLIAVAVWGILRFTISSDPRTETARLGTLRHFAVWAVATVASFTVFGLAPAEIIGRCATVLGCTRGIRLGNDWFARGSRHPP